jgi:hypothetical protein
MVEDAMMRTRQVILSSVLSFAFVLAAHAEDEAKEFEGQRYAPPAENPDNVYFGDTHIHSSLSVDASLWGTTKGPEEIYRYARGEELTSFKGWKVKILRPLDFTVIADHSDAYGFYDLIAEGADFIVAEPQGAKWHKMCGTTFESELNIWRLK